MDSRCSSVDGVALSAWRGQLAATGARRGLRTQLLHHRHELLPHFAMMYRQLRNLPRRVRKALQRQWGVSLAGVALLFALQPPMGWAANFTAGTAAELVTAINTANSTVEADTITLTADITLIAVDNAVFSHPNGLPVIRSAITIAGQGHTIYRDSGAPEFRLLAVSSTGDLTLQDTTVSGGRNSGIFNNGRLTLTNSTVSGNSAAGTGGGIYNRASLTLTNSTVSGNSAGGGGGIYNRVSLTLTNSTVSGNSAAGTGGGIFNSSLSASLTLTNSTVSGNGAGVGGGIGNRVGSVTLTNSMVSGNEAGFGGGIATSGSLTLTNSTVSGNGARGGGGIENFEGRLTLTDSMVSGNGARFGGGIENYGTGASLTLTNSRVSDNAAYDGGGIFNFATGTSVTLTNSTVSSNSATYLGGGIYNRGGLTLTDSTVSSNLAGWSGGGIYSQGNLTLTNSTVSGNAGDRGGGIWNGGSLTLTNSTVSGNAAHDGGGLYNWSGSLTLTNSTVSGNAAFQGGGISNNDLDGGSSLTLSRSLVSGNTAERGAEVHLFIPSSFTATLNLLGHKGLTTAEAIYGFTPDPSDILATADGTTPTALADILDTTLQNNGGPTLTHNLVADSPAIDAAGASCDLTTDQRGAPRPVNGNGVAACDIGAVEFGAFPAALRCSSARATVNLPQLGNRHHYPVTIHGVTAPPGDAFSLTITSIFQDEPVVNPTGKTCPDGIGVGTDVAEVRNERLLAGDGRVYHIGFTATDDEGALCTGEVTVCIPAHKGQACGDQGALFDSMVCP